MINKKKVKNSKPNNTTTDAHAEIGVLNQSYTAGNRGGEAVLTVFGEPVCSYCRSDIKLMVKHLQLEKLEVQQITKHQNVSIILYPPDFEKTKKGGFTWPEVE